MRRTVPKEKAVRKFKCTNCGVCCSGEFAYKQHVTKDEYGVFYAIDPQAKILALWPWEAKRMKQRGDAMNLDVVIRPSSFIVDKKFSRAVILMWFLDARTCPFHIKNRCGIRRDRPFTCKEFPLFGHRTGIGISSQCPDIVRPPLGDDDDANGQAILEAYEEETVHLFKDMEIYKMVFDFLQDLEKNDILKWDKDATPEEATLLIDDKEKRIDLFDLVLENGIMAKAQLEELYEKLDSVEEIRGHVHPKVRKDSYGI